MSASYLLTDIGRGIIRNKISQSEKLILTKVVFGDKSTNLNKEICSKDIELVNPRLSSPIERLYYLRPDNENEILIKLSSVVSELFTDTLEPITIREYGIYDNEDNLIFIGNTNDIYTKIDNDPRDILFDILITLATPVKVIKSVIGHYSGWSPEQKTLIENITININTINTTLVEYDNIIKNIERDVAILKEANIDSEAIREINELLVIVNQKIDNDLPNLAERVTRLEENSTTVDLTEIVDRITALEDAVPGGGGSVSEFTYTNPEPVPVAIGGVPKGMTFDKMGLHDLITMFLYPYQKPIFGVFKINNLTTNVLEVGDTFSGGDVTFTWSITNPQNIKPDTITCNGVSNLPNNGTFSQTINPIKNVTASGHTFIISATTDKDEVITKGVTFNWQFKRYFGVSNKPELTDEDILAMAGELSTTRTKTHTYDCTGGNYFYFIYPSSFGDMNNIRIENFLWDDFTLIKRNMVNAFGISVPVNIYRCNNILNGSVAVNWS